MNAVSPFHAYPCRLEATIKKVPNLVCFYCGRALTVESRALGRMLARSRGGTNEASNLVDCCRPCIGQKGTKTIEEYREYMIGTTSLGRLHHALERFESDHALSEFDRIVVRNMRRELSPKPTHQFAFEVAL